MDNEDVGKPVSDYFGVSDGPTVTLFPLNCFISFSCSIYKVVILFSCSLQVLAYTGNDDAKKFVLDGKVTLDNIKVDILSLSHSLPLPLPLCHFIQLFVAWKSTGFCICY